ncbi:MAG: biotin synthase [Desulfatitalea sp. BRH_c12]|nr:MAG: biotin synthase [Desulfatitalea sp. BRH_c12]
MLNEALMTIARRIMAEEGGCLHREEAMALVPGTPAEALDLISCANKIRDHFMHRHIFKCGIINAKSGRCAEDCAFCAQSAHHQSPVAVYGLRSCEELVQSGLALAEAGANHYGIVTSGTALNDDEIDVVCQAARILKDQSGLKLCASLGMLTGSSAHKLKEAGISRYHHNIETAPSHFTHICSTHAFEDDLDTLQVARSAGMEICSGGILGMGESWEQRVEMAFLLKDLDVDTIPINFLNPIEGTRLAQRPLLEPLEALACIALFRFIHPCRDVTICGGREKTLRDFQSWVFFAGANGLMIGNYLTTAGRSIDTDLEMIGHFGLRESPSPGPCVAG